MHSLQSFQALNATLRLNNYTNKKGVVKNKQLKLILKTVKSIILYHLMKIKKKSKENLNTENLLGLCFVQ